MNLALADAQAPSAELLLYLAEFADDEGKPDDPLAVDRELAPAAEPAAAASTTARPVAGNKPTPPAKTPAKTDDDAAEPAKPDAPR